MMGARKPIQAPVVETFVNRWPFPAILHLERPIASLSSIVERRTLASAPATLATGDYRLVDVWRIARTPDGPNAADVFGQEVAVTYATQIDQAHRDEVTIKLKRISWRSAACHGRRAIRQCAGASCSARSARRGRRCCKVAGSGCATAAKLAMGRRRAVDSAEKRPARGLSLSGDRPAEAGCEENERAGKV
jgi:hypothetical protein